MTPLQELEQKIRNLIPELKYEFDAFEDGSIDRDMITQIMLNHVLVYLKIFGGYSVNSDGYWVCWYLNGMAEYEFMDVPADVSWNLKSAYLKDQPEELITFLNGLK